ncbi:MAG: NapC/NirT family cytochrome c [Gammaproteobacteria bacterium]|nr:NapC/NirT family cytochrome c [Gammaproteobacteria bacterium]
MIDLVIERPRVTLLILTMVLGLVSFLGWVVTESVFEHTGGPDFCGGCHTMQPLVKSFRDDKHGGNNQFGVAAECVDCHLPHESKFHYVLAKTGYGLHDIWAQTFYNLDKIDWLGKRELREDFVYDSGCIACHKDLERASMPNPKAFVAHKPYFMGEIEQQCVSCHQNVGHKNLLDHLALRNEEDAP